MYQVKWFHVEELWNTYVRGEIHVWGGTYMFDGENTCLRGNTYLRGKYIFEGDIQIWGGNTYMRGKYIFDGIYKFERGDTYFRVGEGLNFKDWYTTSTSLLQYKLIAVSVQFCWPCHYQGDNTSRPTMQWRLIIPTLAHLVSDYTVYWIVFAMKNVHYFQYLGLFMLK